MPSAAALRKVGALTNARRSLAAGAKPSKGKNSPQTTTEATAAIMAEVEGRVPQKVEKESRPPVAAIEEMIVAHGATSVVGTALLWTLGRGPCPEVQA